MTMEVDPFSAVMDSAATAPAPPSAAVSTVGKEGGVDAKGEVMSSPSPAPATKPAAAATPPPSTVRKPPPTSSRAASSAASNPPLIDDANEELAVLLTSKKISQQDVTALQSIVRENATLREKVAKLKSLLGRSAKAQRDAKLELDAVKRAHDEALSEVDRLEKRVEALASRPTHMDLLADFETNFDRALLSIGEQQSGGEDPSSGGKRRIALDATAASSSSSSGPAAPTEASSTSKSTVFSSLDEMGLGSDMMVGGGGRDHLLLTELNESRSRITHLESLNAALLHRASHLEKTNEALASERDAVQGQLSNLQLELRMARMETDHATREMREKAASLEEMQMEINLVTKSAMDANKRASEGMELAKTTRQDKEYVSGLEAKVVALQEWALASAEAKRLTVDRANVLEAQLRELQREARLGEGGEANDGDLLPSSSTHSSTVGDTERKLWAQSHSLVVGAGLVGHRVIVLGDCHIDANETVVLRWKFDITPSDMDIYFSILKGRCEDKKRQASADYLMKDRVVHGGGGGEVSGAFAVQNACTLLWDNTRSWVRPRTIKCTVEAYAIE